MVVHHIGYAVKSISESFKLFSLLGFDAETESITDQDRNVEIMFVSNGKLKVELIAPLNDKSPIANYLGKIGNTPYHICYETKDIDQSINELRKSKFLVVEKPASAKAIGESQVAFLYHPNYGLLELVEIN